MTANGSGAWSYALVAADITAMGQGGETLSATARDAAGNTGAAGTKGITIDTLAPAAPSIGLVAGDDVVNAAEQGATVSGTAEANATVDLTLGAGNVRTVTANGSGAWSYTLVAADITAMGQGPETLSATARDAAGNTGAAGTKGITIDTQAPAAPVISQVAGDDVVNAAEQGGTISGTAEGNATVELTLGTGNVRTVTANGSGAWSYTLVAADITAMGQGAETISATARDAAGNTSTAGTRSITIDTQAPAAPVISTVAGDDVIDETEQGATISGTAEANATVELTLGTGNVRTVTANGSGAWSYTLVAADITAMGQGAETISATARDAAGNTSTAGTRNITVSTAPVSGPSLTITDDEPGTANIAGGSVVYTFTFGAAVTGFDASDVTVSGGTKGTVTAVSPTQYTLPVTPTSNSSGTIAVSVAEGAATAVTGGLGNLAATAPSQAFDTSRPQNNQGSFTEVANSTISAGFGEAVTFSSSAGFTLSRLNGATIGFTGLTGNSTSTLVFATTETLGATDVVKVRYDASVGNLADAAGNTVSSFELYIGGSGSSVIDLGAYGSSFSQFLRGNGGADELVGTSGNDVLADGGGADSLRGGRGSDTLRLSEASGYSRDVVIVKRGDSTRTQTDAVLPSGINPTGSGFDTFSATASAHDVLDLQSRVIAADASNVDGIDSGVIARHDITSGIVTFRDASGTVVTIGQATNLGLALTYLEQNITTAGTTVAFRGDFDNNGVADSLWVFQDLGVLSGVTIADTVLRVGYASPTDLAAVTLGTAAGANVLQLQDTTTPEPENFALVTGAAGGLQLQFTETVSLGAQFNTGLTLLKNGTEVMAGTGTANTNVITITTGTALVDTDWVMVRPNYDPLDPARLWQDEAGNLARLAPDDSALAVGGSGDNTMNLSALSTGLSSGFDIRGNAGNDTIVGSAQADEI
ncbi:MAG: hypothetical protein ING49_18220, partial [Rubrivivax sp.]|nr:hypothetical protein [Rubrivivax sp.]